jgi:hypothetical protein
MAAMGLVFVRIYFASKRLRKSLLPTITFAAAFSSLEAPLVVNLWLR